MVELFGLKTGLFSLWLEDGHRVEPIIEGPVVDRLLCDESTHGKSRGKVILCAALCSVYAAFAGPPATTSLPSSASSIPAPSVIPAALFALEAEEVGLARQRERRDVVKRSIYLDEHTTITSDEIKRFLEKEQSPMAPHADEIVLAGNRYGIDPRMIVAIAGVESQYGKRCRGFNAWGWNGGRKQWSSWSESIDRFSASMQKSYPNWRDIPVVAPRYNPNTPEAWGRKVAYLMEAIQATA